MTEPSLADRVAEFGDVAYLITVSSERKPHVVSVVVGREGDNLTVNAGSTTAGNAGQTPTVTLLWPGAADGDYAFIVDGEATVRGGAGDGDATLAIRPGRAVLHRKASADPENPSCVTVPLGGVAAPS